MKLNWSVALAFLLPLHLYAADKPVSARVATITINPGEVTSIHLRPDFESTIRMPEEITSVIVGSPGSFKVEHNEGEPEYVYVKPITKQPAQSNLLIATKSGQHVALELISERAGVAGKGQPVDFLIEYHTSRSFFITSDAPPLAPPTPSANDRDVEVPPDLPAGSLPSSALDEVFQVQMRLNAPSWTKWAGKQIQTSLGDIRQWKNEMVISYSIFNGSDKPVEIVPPQIQITGLKPTKKKAGKDIISDQLEIRDFKLSTTRIEPGGRVDGVVEFDRPNFKQSTEKLFLQIAQADQVDKPILIRLPFTSPISNNYR